MRAIRWWRVIAAIAGASLALWLLRGDATPEARATDITVTITRFHVEGGVEFYRINDGSGDAILSVDADLPIAEWLRRHTKGSLK
jgi:hypothetical protein